MAGRCDDPVEPVGQHQNANMYVNWNWTSDKYVNIDQRIAIQQFAPSTYWALLFNFTDSNQGGYMGLQTTKTGSSDGIAIFSLWGANGCQPGSARSYCVDFGNEGTGKSCRIPYSMQKDHIYRLRVWRLSSDNLGQWWGAWVMDLNTQQEVKIGQIRVKQGTLLKNTANNFVEYFGDAVACNKVPQSIATYYPPTANNNDPTNSHEFGSTYKIYSIANCVRGNVVVQNGAPKVTHGAP